MTNPLGNRPIISTQKHSPLLNVSSNDQSPSPKMRLLPFLALLGGIKTQLNLTTIHKILLTKHRNDPIPVLYVDTALKPALHDKICPNSTT